MWFVPSRNLQEGVATVPMSWQVAESAVAPPAQPRVQLLPVQPLKKTDLPAERAPAGFWCYKLWVLSSPEKWIRYLENCI